MASPAERFTTRDMTRTSNKRTTQDEHAGMVPHRAVDFALTATLPTTSITTFRDADCGTVIIILSRIKPC
jgi:hypothetical protein